MLQSLSIQNYALIDALEISFDKGFSTITGETGAGKSILLGAVSLLIGQRADADALHDKTKKCVVEACFEINDYNLQAFFELNEIDYGPQAIIRREILENGRSRAFVNDTPVNLTILKELGDKLVDIHSQHQNSYIHDKAFQLKVIDILAQNRELIEQYRATFKKYHETKKALSELCQKAESEQKEAGYLQFLYNELNEAKLKAGEHKELEETHEILSHAEEIKTHLSVFCNSLSADNIGVLGVLKEGLNAVLKAKVLMHKTESLCQRTQSVYIELKDIAAEAEKLYESVELDPERLENTRLRLDLLYALCQKHKVALADELIPVYTDLNNKLNAINNYSVEIEALKKQLNEIAESLQYMAGQLSLRRKNAAPGLEAKVLALVHQLGMPNATFTVRFDALDEPAMSGSDEISFLFSANKQVATMDISKVASGGEISRVMLAIKSVIAMAMAMPAIIFDEIDTGVSGEIADKMGNIMKNMANGMQVISITHLPQVAAKGKNHYFVYKTDGNTATNTRIKLLSNNERVTELAKMLSGRDVSEAALENARVLLNS